MTTAHVAGNKDPAVMPDRQSSVKCRRLLITLDRPSYADTVTTIYVTVSRLHLLIITFRIGKRFTLPNVGMVAAREREHTSSRETRSRGLDEVRFRRISTLPSRAVMNKTSVLSS